MKRLCCRKRSPAAILYKVLAIILAAIIIYHLLLSNSSLFFRTSLTLPFSLHLNKQNVYLLPGEELHLSVFAINKRVSYYSTNFRVAGVDFTGRVFAYRTGKAFIVARVAGKELKCRVHVINISRKTLWLKAGQTYHLRIKGAFAIVRWRSNHSAVAGISIFGTVKARSRGSAIVTARVKGRTLHCNVNIE